MTDSPKQFPEIYESVCEEVFANLERQGLDISEIFLEPVTVADSCFISIPREALLAIESDEEFVEACSFKVPDVPIPAGQKGHYLKLMELGMSREQLLARMTETHMQYTVVLGPL